MGLLLQIVDWFTSLDVKIQVPIIAGIVALVTTLATTTLTPIGTYLVGKKQQRNNLILEYEYEQRKHLRELIGRYHGRILRSAEQMSHRLFNLYDNENEGWLRVPDNDYRRRIGYYFNTTTYRFLAVYAHVHQFRAEAVYIDSRIAEKNDLNFEKYLGILRLAATDTQLFEGMQYDRSQCTDHFYADTLREACGSLWTEQGFTSLGDFESKVGVSQQLDGVLKFFNDLKRDEDRLRWDRMVAIHLMLLAFINTFGYDFQRVSDQKMLDVAGKFNNHRVGSNLVDLFSELRLGDKEAQRVKRAVRRVQTPDSKLWRRIGNLLETEGERMANFGHNLSRR